MPRLLGVDIPGKKKLEYSLRSIYGVGPDRAKKIVQASEIDPATRAHALTEEQLNKLTSLITEEGFAVEGDLRREIAANLKRLQSINCYRGLRHRMGLPVRGQRTSTNSRTRKGARKTVGVVRKK